MTSDPAYRAYYSVYGKGPSRRRPGLGTRAYPGVEPYAHYVWLGKSSRDTYDGAALGLASVIAFVEDAGLQAQARDIATRLGERLVADQWFIRDGQGSLTHPSPRWRLAMMRLLLSANPERFGRLAPRYARHADQMRRRGPRLPGKTHRKYYLANLNFARLFVLNILETDPARRDRFQEGLRNTYLRQCHDHLNAYFAAIYMFATGDTEEPRARATFESMMLDFPPPPKWARIVDHRGKGVPMAGKHFTRDAQYVSERIPHDFIWQRPPCLAHGGQDIPREYPGIDFFLPYWLGRAGGFVPEYALHDVDLFWDFNDGDPQGWEFQEGQWRTREHALMHNDQHFHGGLAAQPGLALGDVIFEADLCIGELFHDTETVWVGLIVRASDPMAHGAWHDGYLLMVRANGMVELLRMGDGALAAVATAYRPAEQTIRLKLEAIGPELRGFVNEEALFSVRDDAYARGEVALVNFGNVAAFDNVRLRGVRAEKPQPQPVEPEHPAPPRRDPVAPLPRIAVRKDAEQRPIFVRQDTGERFIPRGFNHTVLDDRAGGCHATFNVGIYDPDAMEATLAAMRRVGANVIRVWAWGFQNETGFTKDPSARGLNAAYMENFVDFLRRAARHNIHVMPILDQTPRNAYYDAIAAEAEEKDDAEGLRASGHNRQYLMPGPLAAKCAGTRDFIRYIRDADPGLLQGVFGWALANEVCVRATEAPFRHTAGLARIGGKSYDMADPAQRQACYDDAVLRWANTLADAIKEVDPDALVTAGMWTADAHGRPAFNGLPLDGRDPRIPPRPSVLGGPDSRLDFLDIHIYPWDGTSAVRPDAHEHGHVLIPVIVGEYGVFKNKSIEEARIMLHEILDQAWCLGYQGDIHWVWDLTRTPGQTWSAVEHNLAEHVMRWQPSQEN